MSLSHSKKHEELSIKKIIYEGIKAQRVDKALAECCPLSRSKIQALIKSKQIRVNQHTVTVKELLKPGDEIEILIDLKKHEVLPEKIHLNIVYEDKDIIVVDKEKGMMTQATRLSQSGTLVNALLYHCGTLPDAGDEYRPGIVHRLDRMTSGLLVAAKNEEALQYLKNSFKNRAVVKKYYAMVHGNIPQDEMTITAPIGRDKKNGEKRATKNMKKGTEKYAKTILKVLKRFNTKTLVEAIIETGRTHQIRVHLHHIGHPIIGDPMYYKKSPGQGQQLQAYYLEFEHPRTQQKMIFTLENSLI